MSSILFYSTRKSKILRKKIFRKNYILKKMDRVARRGPLARIKVSQCRKPERGPFGVFKHPICCKTSKKLKGGSFGEKKFRKNSQCRKTEREDPLGFSNIHSVAKQQKKWRGDPLGEKCPEKKSRSAEKKLEGGTLCLAGYGMLRGKTGKTFLAQFARPNSAIWCNNIL